MMNLIERYQRARQEVEQRFFGLPYIHTALIGLLLSRAQASTGIVEGITYQELCNVLTVQPAPGRKEAGTPPKSTVRSVLKTIESVFNTDFKIISEGQQLLLKFINLPQIYKKYDLISEEISDQICDQDHAETKVNQGEFSDQTCVQISDQNTEKHTEKVRIFSPVKNINIKNKHKQHTHTTSDVDFFTKEPIRDDFYPNQETIAKALALGLDKVTDQAEINKFIAYNQARHYRWPDFNPYFLQWLKHDKNTRKVAAGHVNTRSHHERRTSKSNHFEALMQRVFVANKEAASPSQYIHMGQTDAINPTYPMALDADDSYLWPTVYQ